MNIALSSPSSPFPPQAASEAPSRENGPWSAFDTAQMLAALPEDSRLRAYLTKPWAHLALALLREVRDAPYDEVDTKNRGAAWRRLIADGLIINPFKPSLTQAGRRLLLAWTEAIEKLPPAL